MSDSLTALNELLSGRYSVERQIGEGGMAAVFVADDLKHRRKVAIKFLRPELAAAVGVDRFLKEIEITASLQHPHILPLHDSGEANGSVFYVMPFVEGETLRDRLSRERQLPIDDATRIAADICDALEYAHRRGIVHRDVKPENILLHEGGALVMDFGIALAVANVGDRLTQAGVSLGTPQYMSPEQASGEQTVDGRADLYALGCVLYEMLVGEPPFVGPTAQAIIVRVLGDAPRPPTSLRPRVPANVNDAVLTALQKIPADRFASASQFAGALQDRGNSTRAGDVVTRPGIARTIGRVAPWIVAAGAIFTAALTLRGRTLVDSPHVVRFSLTLPSPLRFDLSQLDNAQSSLALTPDGSHVLFLLPHEGGRQIYVRALGSDEVRPIAGTDGARYLFTSPDGGSVAFETTEGNLYRVPIAGGPVTTIAKSASASHGSWGAKGLIAFSGGAFRPLMVVPAGGGEPKGFTTIDTAQGEVAQGQPWFLPDGNAVVFTSFRRNGERTLAAATLDGRVKQLGLVGTSPAFVPPNHLLFARPDGVLRAVSFDPKTFAVSGPSVPVAEGIGGYGAPWNLQVAIASSGNSLAFARGQRLSRLALLGVDGVIRLLPGEARNYQQVRVSPDGARIAAGIVTDELRDVWTYDIKSGVGSRVTVDGHSGGPTWSPDGKRLAFTRVDLQTTGVEAVEAPSDGSGAPTRIVDGPGNHIAAEWRRDGKAFVYGEITASGLSRLSEMDSGGARRVLVDSPSGLTTPAVSPDGRWLAYVSSISRRLEVSVHSMHEGSHWQVSLQGGTDPVWSRDSKTLFYRDGVHIVAASIEPSPGFVVTSRRIFADDHFAPSYDAMPDGKHLLVLVPDETDAGITILANWRWELERRLATHNR